MRTLKLGSTGPYVELLQSILKKLNFYFGAIDGIFGIQTQLSVQRFQKANNIKVDGVVGVDTWNALMPYINGYITYTIQKGDTFYKIAQKYESTVDALIFANPHVDYENLVIGEQITVPISSVVPTNISYCSDFLNMNIASLKKIYPFLEVTSIGTTVMGRNISVIKFGNGQKEVFYNASIHANEWINSVVIMKFIENLAKSYVNNVSIFGYDPRQLFSMVSLYIVPMINLDGVDLVTGLFSEGTWAYANAKRISANFPDIPFPDGWKANIEGVDLKNYQPFCKVL